MNYRETAISQEEGSTFQERQETSQSGASQLRDRGRELGQILPRILQDISWDISFTAAFFNILILEESLKYVLDLGEVLLHQAQIQARIYKIIIFISCISFPKSILSFLVLPFHLFSQGPLCKITGGLRSCNLQTLPLIFELLTLS